MTKELQEFITRDRKITSAEDLQARISNLREQFGSAPDEKARCSAAWFEYCYFTRSLRMAQPLTLCFPEGIR